MFVCRTEAELDAGLRAAAALGGPVVVEELLEGWEASVFALCDGGRAVPLGAAQDFKRAGDGDTGPNTGGMGAYSPVDWLGDAAPLVEAIHQPVLDELARRGTPFVGCLFAGLMVGDDGPSARVQRSLRRPGDRCSCRAWRAICSSARGGRGSEAAGIALAPGDRRR